MVIIVASGSKVRGFDPGQGRCIFSEHKNPEYDFLWKGSKAMGPMSLDLRYIKEPQAEIRASEQNLSDFSRSMTLDVKKCRETQQQQLERSQPSFQ